MYGCRAAEIIKKKNKIETGLCNSKQKIHKKHSLFDELKRIKDNEC